MFTGRRVKLGEADWTLSDTEAVLALVADEDARCSGCGQPRDETLKPENWRKYTAEAYTCAGCWERDRFVESFDGDRKGLIVPVRPPSV